MTAQLNVANPFYVRQSAGLNRYSNLQGTPLSIYFARLLFRIRIYLVNVSICSFVFRFFVNIWKLNKESIAWIDTTISRALRLFHRFISRLKNQLCNNLLALFFCCQTKTVIVKGKWSGGGKDLSLVLRFFLSLDWLLFVTVFLREHNNNDGSLFPRRNIKSRQ